jgi:hypothetical protein
MDKEKPDWSAIGRSSKNKGKTGERRLAKLLTEFTGEGFRKIPGSGGYNKTGGVTVAEHKFCGDVICDSANFAFCMEAKNRPSDFNLAAITTSPESAQFTSWWYQVNAEAKHVNLLPLLYFKLGNSTNNVVKNDYLAMTPTVANYLGMSNKVLHASLHVYYEPVWVTINVKVKGKAKKEQARLFVKLPNPWLISWVIFSRHADKSKLFVLPNWVSEELKAFEIIDRNGPDNVIWPKETI